MNALVTGGAGFIGSHVGKHLLKLGMRVIILDDLSGGFAENVPDGAEFVQGSVTDYELLNSLFAKEKVDFIFHLAAYAAEGLSHFIRRYNYLNNLLGSINLINLSIKFKIKVFVFTSSLAVYGTNQVPMMEDMTPHPEDPYGISKYAVELDLEAAHHQFGLNYIIFRPHNVYGEHQNVGDKYRNVIGIFMNQILLGEALTIFGDGEQTRAFSYIDDVAPFIARSVLDQRVYGEIFNIGGDQPYTINELVRVVSECMDVKTRIIHLRPRSEVKHAFCSHDKIKRFFDLPPPVSLMDGVSKMAEWAKKNGSRRICNFTAIEILEGLPESWR